jgi:hypothetical protein
MKTKLEIIKETVNYYTTEQNSRAMDGLDCVYNATDGSHCAVGRCFTDSYKSKGIDFAFNLSTEVSDLDAKEGGLDSFLAEEYKGHNTGFWNGLQLLHDREYNWIDDFTLSARGKEYVEKLKKENS